MPMPGRMSVAAIGAVRPGTPSLATRTALAPAEWAFCAFCNVTQVPRRRSTTAPRGKPAKSDASQPLEGEAGSTGTTCAVALPLPE
jgi:hypothetical protein